jgi:hypothetical protein
MSSPGNDFLAYEVRLTAGSTRIEQDDDARDDGDVRTLEIGGRAA